jgi:outer membrane protein assembly factor BamB
MRATTRVLIGSQDQHFYCLNKETGAVIWSFATSSRLDIPAGVRDGAVYFGSSDGKFYRLDMRTGRKVWSFQCDAGSAVYSPPLVAEAVVYFNGSEGKVYALGTADGRLKWKFRPLPGSEIKGGLDTDGQRLFLTTGLDIKDQGERAIFAIGRQK